MGTTADKLNKLLETKEAIKQAIRDKGVEVADHDVFAAYPNAIRKIETGSGGGEKIDGSYIIAKFPEHMRDGDNFIKQATELDVSNLDVGNVRDMSNMFSGYQELTILDLSSWNTSNVEYMNRMFNNCGRLTELNLSNFDMINVRDTDSMFGDCYSLHTLRLDNCSDYTIRKIIESSDFPTGYVYGETRKMYVTEKAVADLTAPDGWVFINHETGEEIITEKPDGIPLYERGQFKRSSDTEISTMVTKEHDDLSDMFLLCENLTTINSIDQWDTSNVRDMRQMFMWCRSLKTLNLSSFNTSSVENMEYMFSNCENLEELDISNFEISNECNVMSMFGDCRNLHTLRLDNCGYDTIDRIIRETNLLDEDIEIDGEWQKRKMYVNPDNVGDIRLPNGWEFVYVSGEEEKPVEPEEPELPEGCKLYEVGMFSNAENVGQITEVNVMVNNTHTDLNYMFGQCNSLTTIHNMDLWDTSNVTTMNSMFSYCFGLTILDLSNFNTSNVTDMASMFSWCNSLESLNLSNFDMSNVIVNELATCNNCMFEGCNALCDLRLHNCNYDTINKIINSVGFPTGSLDGVTRKIYVNPDNVGGMTPPENWVFINYETGEEIVQE